MTSPELPRHSLKSSSPSSQPIDLGIVDALVQSSFSVQAMLGDLAAEHDLSITQLRLLGVLRDRKLRMAQLAQVLHVSRQSATGLVDRAERRGLIARLPIPVDDERAVHVGLTAEGHALAGTVVKQVSGRIAALAGSLSESERAYLSLLLSRLVADEAELYGIDLQPHLQGSAAP